MVSGSRQIGMPKNGLHYNERVTAFPRQRQTQGRCQTSRCNSTIAEDFHANDVYTPTIVAQNEQSNITNDMPQNGLYFLPSFRENHPSRSFRSYHRKREKIQTTRKKNQRRNLINRKSWDLISEDAVDEEMGYVSNISLWEKVSTSFRNNMKMYIAIILILLSTASAIIIRVRNKSPDNENIIEKDQIQILRTMLKDSALISGLDKKKYDDHSTPQFKAIEWLISNTDANSGIDFVEGKLLQPSDITISFHMYSGQSNGLPEGIFDRALRIELIMERYALIVFYFSTMNDNNERFLSSSYGGQKKWISKSNVCIWKGVACHSYLSVVTGLSLPKNGLRGILPPELAYLRSLEMLDLSNNFLTGQVNKSLGTIPQLGKTTLLLFCKPLIFLKHLIGIDCIYPNL